MITVTGLQKTLRSLAGAKDRIHQEAARTVAHGLEPEIEQLVVETAQYSGHTAASWRVGYGLKGGHGEAEGFADDRRSPNFQPKSAGHSMAVGYAMWKIRESLMNYVDNGYRYGDLNIYNNSALAEPVMTGNMPRGSLRAVNEISVGALERFKSRVVQKSYIIAKDIFL